MLENLKKEKKQAGNRQAVLIGYLLDDMPLYTRNRLFKAAVNMGWDESRFYTKSNVRLFAKICRQVRDNMMAEGLSTGLEDLDRAFHRLSSYLKVPSLAS